MLSRKTKGILLILAPILLSLMLFTLTIIPVYAQEAPLFSTKNFMGVSGLSTDCVDKGDCNLCDMFLIGIRLAQLLLGISGAVALLLFIVGGFIFIISSGNQQMIERGKKIITGTLIGLLIVFGSWQIINLIIVALVSTQIENIGESTPLVIGNSWTKLSCE